MFTSRLCTLTLGWLLTTNPGQCQQALSSQQVTELLTWQQPVPRTNRIEVLLPAHFPEDSLKAAPGASYPLVATRAECQQLARVGLITMEEKPNKTYGYGFTARGEQYVTSALRGPDGLFCTLSGHTTQFDHVDQVQTDTLRASAYWTQRVVRRSPFEDILFAYLPEIYRVRGTFRYQAGQWVMN